MLLQPRSKIYVGIRLAKAAYNSVESYGGKAAYTGPTLSGCTLGAKSLKINFDPTMLRGDKVVLQKYGKPNFTCVADLLRSAAAAHVRRLGS